MRPYNSITMQYTLLRVHLRFRQALLDSECNEFGPPKFFNLLLAEGLFVCGNFPRPQNLLEYVLKTLSQIFHL